MIIRTKQVDFTSNGNGNQGKVQSLLNKKLLTFYNDPPKEELSLDEFERFAFDRLQLLRKIEAFNSKGLEGNDLTSKMESVHTFNVKYTNLI